MLALSALVVICLASSSLASSILAKPYYDLEDAESLFKDFIKEHEKSYTRNEYLKRLEIFKDNLKEINKQNAKQPQAVFRVNRFADMTRDEQQRYKCFKPPTDGSKKVTIPDSSDPAPEELDYRKQNLVTEVKDQGQCGSCYIYSAVGNIEGQYAKKHKNLTAFSEGQCLDCLKCGTCEGGIMDAVMNELATRAGLETEADYPYEPIKSTCQEDASKVVAHLKGGKEIDIPNEEVLKQKLADIGPLAVALNAADFGFYDSGILHPNQCNGQDPNHGVVLVGYGTDKDGTKFWIIKNSWSQSWGENGYVRLLRGVDACKMGTSYTATADVE